MLASMSLDEELIKESNYSQIPQLHSTQPPGFCPLGLYYLHSSWLAKVLISPSTSTLTGSTLLPEGPGSDGSARRTLLSQVGPGHFVNEIDEIYESKKKIYKSTYKPSFFWKMWCFYRYVWKILKISPTIFQIWCPWTPSLNYQLVRDSVCNSVYGQSP